MPELPTAALLLAAYGDAVISRPRLLMLDEPLVNLDLRSEQGIVSVLARLAREQQITVLIGSVGPYQTSYSPNGWRARFSATTIRSD